jgi:hypothetical protein
MTVNRAIRRAEAAGAKPINRPRGDYLFEVFGDGDVPTHSFRLRMTMAALAEIETGLNIDSIAEIQASLESLSSRKIGIILGALARGGGEDVTDDEMRALPIMVNDAFGAIMGAFTAAGAINGPQSAGNTAPGN